MTNEIHDESAPRQGKVTMRESVARAAPKQTDEVTDSLGRKLKVRKVGALGRYDLAKLVGGDNVTNLGIMAPATMVYSVTAIDGDPVFPPVTELELRALINRLEQEGIDAVAKAYMDNGWMPAPVDEAALKN